MKTLDIYILSLIILVFCFSCTEDDESNLAGTFYGKAVNIGEGTVKSFVTTDEAGKPVSMGVAFSKEGLSLLPQGDANHMMFEYVLELPDKLTETPIDHIVVDWNPMGHEPDGIYTIPHFDFHFYMITEAERMNIGVNDPKIDMVPDAQYLPADYITTPGGVPMMGKHWLDKFSPELAGQPFTTTFIYGSYNGKVSFLEPMITLAHILSKPEQHLEVKQPASFDHDGYYPTKYAITYDAATEQYLIVLENMEKRTLAANSNTETNRLLASVEQSYTGFETYNFPICRTNKTLANHN